LRTRLCRLLSDAGRRPLRSNSNDMRELLVPLTHNKLGDMSFSAAGPQLWNDLPARTTTAGTLLQLLQTISENSSLWRLKRLVTLLNYRRYINIFIYLSRKTGRQTDRQTNAADNLSLATAVGMGIYQCG